MSNSQKKKRNKLEEPTLNHSQQLEECFDKESEYYNKMMLIINTSDNNKDFVQKHHIVPRSYFNHKAWKVDNSDENIAYITAYEHALVHYYAWKCSKSIIRKSMASAWHFMVNTAAKGLMNIQAIAEDYARARIDMVSNKKSIDIRLSNLKSTFICKDVDKINRRALVHCQNCGFEKWISLSYHKCDAYCKYCKFESNRPYKGKYGLMMVIAADKHAYYLSFDVAENKCHAYSWDKLMTFACRWLDSYKEGFILKWKLIGATDIKYRLPYICPVSKDYVENYMYFAKLGSGIRNALFPNKPVESMIKYAQYYNIEIPENLDKEKYKSVKPEYYIEEFCEWHTIIEWENLLGYTWATICKKYSVQRAFSDREALAFLINLYKKDPSILERIESEFKKWY